MPNAVAAETLDLCKLGHLEDGDPEELGGQMADFSRFLPAEVITDDNELEQQGEAKSINNIPIIIIPRRLVIMVELRSHIL